MNCSVNRSVGLGELGVKVSPMSFKSIIQDVKGELGSISGKGKSRLLKVVQDSSIRIDAFEQSCWANMPYELLRDVLMRIEASEVTWPPRKTVVACASVCRKWREIMKELVKTPEISSNLTFPISLKQVINANMYLFLK